MAEFKGTPGPWRIRGDRLGGIEVDDGRAGNDGMVAVVYLRTPSSQEEPNARLISAAPDLLAACEAALGFMDEKGYGGETYRVLRAALAKATGQG